MISKKMVCLKFKILDKLKYLNDDEFNLFR